MLRDLNYWQIVTTLVISIRWTILLTLIAFLGGGLVGIGLTLMRISPVWIVKRAAILYIAFFQGTPLLMQLFLAFFGVALIGIEIPAWAAASIALSAFTSAFLADIWRGSIESIPKGQWEAARSLGLGYLQILRLVILPQSIKLLLPPTVGFLVQVIKATSLTSIIGFVELTKTATSLANITFQPFFIYLITALLYFYLCYPLSLFSRRLERRFSYRT